MKQLYPSNYYGDSDDGEITEFEGMHLNANWGFKFNKDGEEWKAVICEDWVDKHLSPLLTS